MSINKVTDKQGKPIKKDGKIKYRVRIHKKDENGKEKQIERVAYGMDEAKLVEKELMYNIGEMTSAGKITLKTLFAEYIEAKKHEVRESSLSKSKQVLNIHVLPELGNYKLDKLSVSVLSKWKQNINNLELTITTKKNIYKEFRTMLNYAVKMEYLSKNPLLKVGNFKAPLELKKEMDFYTPEEFQKFIGIALKYAEDKNPDIIQWGYYVFFCIAFYTGMRKGEINALNWNDIRNGEISVTKSVTQKLSGGDRFTPPKNQSSIRTVQIPMPLQEVLDEHKIRCSQIDGYSDDFFVCGGMRPLRDTSIENANERFAKEANVKKIRIHDFRHSHASLLANKGINIQEIARRLGHADVSITLKVYSHLYPKESERALGILNEIEIIPRKSPKKQPRSEKVKKYVKLKTAKNGFVKPFHGHAQTTGDC